MNKPWENDMLYDGTASILFQPVCSVCKRVLYEKIDFVERPDIIPNKLAHVKTNDDYYVVPKRCPYCDSFFTMIQMPTKLPFDNREGDK